MYRLSLKNHLMLMVYLMIAMQANAQLKTYSGPFSDGTATYSFRDTETGRLYEGRFSYTSSDGKHSYSGNFVNDLKDGVWTADWFGFKETIRFVAGWRDGEYSLKYDDGLNRLNVKAYFEKGVLKDGTLYMRNARGIEVKSPDLYGSGCWILTGGGYEAKEYYYRHTLVGVSLQNTATGDYERPAITSMQYSEASAKIDSVINTGRLNGVPYKLEPQTQNEFLSKNHQLYDVTQLFGLASGRLPQYMTMFSNDLHFWYWDDSLTRGEYAYRLPIYYVMTENSGYIESVRKFADKFYSTEYGKLIKYMKANATKDNLDECKEKYRNELLKRYRFTYPIALDYDSAKRTTFGLGLIDFEMFVSEELADRRLLAIPTQIMLTETGYEIDKAVILYMKGDTWLIEEQLKGLSVYDYLNNAPHYCHLKLQGGFVGGEYIMDDTDIVELSDSVGIKDYVIYYTKWDSPKESDIISSLKWEEIILTDEQRFERQDNKF